MSYAADADAILTLTTPPGASHVTPAGGDTRFTWDYEQTRAPLVRLYEKAKMSQWNASVDVDWTIEVDQEGVAQHLCSINPEIQLLRDAAREDRSCPLYGWSDAQFARLAFEQQAYMLSQFMHGEQGALVCTAKICEQVPWIDAKYYAATQVVDEARHVEVFTRYLNDKLEGEYPVNPHLLSLLDDIIADDRWDMTYLGMQVMVEGLALAAFGLMMRLTSDPLLARILRYVLADEARHVAFGVLSLREVYESMSLAEVRERQEFAFEAGLRMRDRGFAQDLWEGLGVDPHAMLTWHLEHVPKTYNGVLFSKIVPNVKKLGLLDAGDGWLRRKYTEIGVIGFEDWVDTSEEYGDLDAVAADRAG